MFATKKSVVLIILALVCIVIAVVAYRTQGVDEVYTRTVSLEEGPLLSPKMQEWIKTQRAELKISAYSYSNDGVYELLLVDNRQDKQNLYLHTSIQAKQQKGKLLISVNDTSAVSDEEVAYNQETYFILKDKPEVITLSINGSDEYLTVEEGTWPITE